MKSGFCYTLILPYPDGPDVGTVIFPHGNIYISDAGEIIRDPSKYPYLWRKSGIKK